jgi:thiol-disulfide isomerase/thioredoxin
VVSATIVPAMLAIVVAISVALYAVSPPQDAVAVAVTQAPAFRPIAGTFNDRLAGDNHSGRVELVASADRALPGVVAGDRVFRANIRHIRPAAVTNALAVAVVEAKDGGFLFVDANLDGRMTDNERTPYTAADRSSARDVSIDVQAQHEGAAVIPFRCRIVTEPRDGAARLFVVYTGIFRAEGYAEIGGNRTLVSLPYYVDRNAVDIRRGMVRIGAKTTFVDNERLIFRVGDRHVSLESADFAARSFVLREHAPEEYRLIEIRRGDPLPDFAFTDVDGRPRTLADFRGKYLLLDFWGTWCAPCVAELPLLKQARERFRHRGFEILGMDFEYSATADHVRSFLAARKIPWPNAAPDSVKDLIRNRYRIMGFPTLVLLDPDGLVVEIHGHATEMVAALERILERRLP